MHHADACRFLVSRSTIPRPDPGSGGGPRGAAAGLLRSGGFDDAGRAAHIAYNSARGNLPFRTCSAACTERATDANNGQGGGTGAYPGNSNWWTGTGTTGTWETWIGRRGDVARAMLYADLRYEGGVHGVTGVAEPDLRLTDDPALIQTSGGSNASVAYMGLLSVLLQWHEQDPVDALERHRNDVVASYQGNRNPFVDHPDLVDCLYAGDCGSFYSVPPCRVLDTRQPDGAYGGPLLTSGAPRIFEIAGQCGVPATAEAISVNVTVIGATGSGNLTFFRGDQTPGATSAINFSAGLVRANNAVLPLSLDGDLGVQAFVNGAGQVHLVVDIGGYYD